LKLIGVGQRIRVQRGKLSQDEFAEKMGMKQKYISQVEREEVKPSINLLIKILEYNGTSIDYILTGIGHNSGGMATNQSFVGMEKIADTPLAKSMFQTLHQISKKVGAIADGVQRFDRIGNEFDNLKALQGTPSALSTNLKVRCYLDDTRNCCSPGYEGLS